MITDVNFKQKQIASLGSNVGYQGYWKNYFEPYLQGRKNRELHQMDYPNSYKNLSGVGTGLKELNKVNLINQFYNIKRSHEDQRLLDTLLKKRNPEASLKEQKRDALKTFYESRFRSSTPSTELSLLNNNSSIV
jgi:hypothetical protein